MLSIRIRANVLHGQSFHESLLSQISDLRMGKMMDALHINKARYTQQESIIDIHNHMNHCKSCENTVTCDEKIDSDTIDANTLDYCSNEAAMNELIQKHHSSNNP